MKACYIVYIISCKRLWVSIYVHITRYTTYKRSILAHLYRGWRRENVLARLSFEFMNRSPIKTVATSFTFPRVKKKTFDNKQTLKTRALLHTCWSENKTQEKEREQTYALCLLHFDISADFCVSSHS